MAVGDAILSQRAIAVPPEGLQAFAKEYVEQWCATCTNFLRWEREHILKAHPSPQQQEEHRQVLKWLLRLTRLIHSVTADPDFPDRSVGELLEMKLWQLNESWKMIYEPMPEAEANKVLDEVFPGWNEG